ncbi:MAG: DUF1302 family protein [Candidatus Thiodiazotropha sp.]
MNKQTVRGGVSAVIPWVVLCVATTLPLQALAWQSKDGTLEVRGFVEDATYVRDDVGLTKQRLTGQVEFAKDMGARGIFSEFSINGTFRGSYDAVYDLKEKDFGDEAGGAVSFPAPANTPFFASLPGSPGFPVTDSPVYAGTFGPLGLGDGAIPLPGANPLAGGTAIAGPDNPNDGLVLAAEDVYDYSDNGVMLATPVRPCDTDDRGCEEGIGDKDLDELRFAEFNDRADFLRELYVAGTVPMEGHEELTFTFGRQQVVWGRTDLFRVLDVINPVDFSRNNIYDELEDSRIPMGILTVEHRKGATDLFEDLNFQVVWKWEKFRPHSLGQGGQPYRILGIGNALRALKNCWDNGCTVGNFPAPGVTVDFPSQTIGIRDVNLPDWDAGELGLRMEGVYKGVGFSVNALRYRSQLPSLRGGIASDNPFTPPVENQVWPYSLAFDVEYPWITLLGGSLDIYSEPMKSAIRIEAAYTRGEEFPDTLSPRLFSESDVVRWVVGIDRPTFIPFLNERRAFLISAQLFGQHLLDHRTSMSNNIGLPTTNEVGFVDWENNYIATLLIQGNYMNDRLTPQLLTAWDFKAGSGVAGPSLTYKPSNNWVITAGFNIKFGDGAIEADDNRSAVPYSPFPFPAPQMSSTGLSGFEPLGRFRSGPIGSAINEDEFQLTVRYQF